MEPGKVSELLEKFYAGETTLEEERALKAHFRKGGIASPDEDKLLFRYLEYAKSEQPANKFELSGLEKVRKHAPVGVRRLSAGIWAVGIAASVLLLVGIFSPGWLKKQHSNPLERSVATNEQASAQIRNALLKISVNLNKGEQNAAKISKFSQAQKLVISKKSKK